MSVEKIDKSNLEAELRVTVKKTAYEPLYLMELKKYRQKAQMKGFRKGKVPMSMIKKMYGQSVLADVVNGILEKEMSTFFQEEKMRTLGQPIPSERQQQIDFDASKGENFEFIFDIGVAPHVEVKGLEEKNVYTQWKVEVTDPMIDEQLESMRQQGGQRKAVEEVATMEDVLTLNAWELAEDGSRKTKGLETSFQLAVDLIANEDLQKQVLESKAGDSLRFNVFELERDRDESFVRKHLLKLDEDDMDREVAADFEGEIVEVLRLHPADLDQEFFDRAFGKDVVTSEEEARKFIEESIQNDYDKQAEALLFRDFQEDLMEENPLELPDAYLKRWLVISSEENTAETVEKGYKSFARGLRWNMIETQIQEDHKLEVDQQDIRDGLRAQIEQYMRGYPLEETVMEGFVDRSMADEKQVKAVYDEKMSDLTFEKIRELVTVQEVPVTVEELQEKMEEARRSMSFDEEE